MPEALPVDLKAVTGHGASQMFMKPFDVGGLDEVI